ncbi:MAG TPA: hypothetical protein VN885_02885 [Candidatus Acidoferrales bacterium]|nr:hypothetical protein [Candidatus Acidoferrales bacterium]
MPDVKKLDPFKPQQPTIPGVEPQPERARPEASAAPALEPRREVAAAPVSHAAQPKIILIVLGAVVAVVLVGGLILWGKVSSSKAIPVSADTTAPSDPPPPAPAAPSEPMGPGAIATVGELAKPWASKHFQYRNYVSGQLEPAMVVHLPHGEYWGFSLVEPFGTCQLEFVTDLDKLKADYGYRAEHPMVADPCNHTVYDLLRYGGGASSDDLVRGVIVQGNGIRPPMAIEIKVQGDNVVAGRSE